MTDKYPISIIREGKFYIARCLTLDVTSQGETLEQARDNIQEAIELYIESFGAPKKEH